LFRRSTVREIGAFEAKNTLGTLLDMVARGEEVVITRRGKPIAKLVPTDAGADRTKALAAARRMMALRKGVVLGDDVSVKDLIDEGRR